MTYYRSLGCQAFFKEENYLPNSFRMNYRRKSLELKLSFTISLHGQIMPKLLPLITISRRNWKSILIWQSAHSCLFQLTNLRHCLPRELFLWCSRRGTAFCSRASFLSRKWSQTFPPGRWDIPRRCPRSERHLSGGADATRRVDPRPWPRPRRGRRRVQRAVPSRPCL